MTIPRAPFILGFASLIPFVWGALTVLSPDLNLWTARTIGPRFAGPHVLLIYGSLVLGFLSGVLVGFATRLEPRKAALGYFLAVLPALWAFLVTGVGAPGTGLLLMVGYVGILGIEWLFSREGVAPQWWMPLRLALTMVVLVCLLIGVTA